MKSQLSPAEDLPSLYRAVLDGVAVLEHRGERMEAARIRQAAIRAYSTSWNDEQVRRLEQLVDRCQGAIEHTRPTVNGQPIF